MTSLADMTPRQRLAITNILHRADAYHVINKLTRDEIIPGGNILRTILAIDK